MNNIYRFPLRVYLILGCLALFGLISGMKLPISLFPNSNKPKISVNLNYGSITGDEFLKTYGKEFEEKLQAASFQSHQVEKVTSTYWSKDVRFEVEYRWGAPPVEAMREIEKVSSAYAAQLPEDIRDSLNIWTQNDNAGFLAVSYYSETRSLDELYKFLEPQVAPLVSNIEDAAFVELWNPTRKEVLIELNPEKIASLQILPKDVGNAVRAALTSNSAGSVMVGLNNLEVSLDRQTMNLADLQQVLVTAPSGRAVHLGEIARIDFGTRSSSNQVFKTSGMASLILYAEPKPGGNVKKMSEDILAAVGTLTPRLPADVKSKVLVDPSEFIRSAVENVLHEVILAALLAVCILFLFIGNLKNVITAAIEIPLSIVLAFILMRLTGINLNLISLGGLALSAGMNVDASVVVMENIFRHFDNHPGKLSAQDRFNILVQAVREVQFPIMASTVASLVVFLPLAFTSALTNAVLGDLAMAVVFSHGFSALVALVLVPTVRLQLMKNSSQTHSKSPLEKWFRKFEDLYVSALRIFLGRARLRYIVYGSAIVSLAALIAFVLPNLPRELIGTPDTDWISMRVSTQGNTIVKQMESQAEEVEANLLQKYGSSIQYTFTQIRNPNSASIMARLKDKRDMMKLWKDMENHFADTPYAKFKVNPWNPSELPIPDPPHMRVVVRGEDAKKRALAAKEVSDILQEKKIFSRVWTDPNVDRKEKILFQLNHEQWTALQRQGVRVTPADVADLARVATIGRKIGDMYVDGQNTRITMAYPQDRVASAEDLASLPIGIGGKLIPLKALASVTLQEVLPSTYRESGKDLAVIYGRENKDSEGKAKEDLKKATEEIEIWSKNRTDPDGAIVSFEDSQKDMNDALRQLGIAVALSVFLIFITMVLQFGDVMNSLLVLVSIPLGFIGALLSLFIFQSTLSLNSVLGVILLNGIAVANSIILVDFLKRLVDAGVKPERAALEAAKKRMRPILMTSLTTGLGMLPIALGLGDGGRILQPLGIAVIGGLGFSTFMTLFIVPALQASYLQWQHRRDEESEWLDDSHGLAIESILESGEKKKPAREELEEGLASS
jgi:hydrophobic/amphiphilic exporter-1 (mainly G- bacteria), HAE1 family